MKIYASDFVNTELDDFIGEDVWVKVDGTDWARPQYAQILEKYIGPAPDGGACTCYMFKLMPLFAYDTKVIDEELNDRFNRYASTYYNIWVYQPMDVVTTDELYDVLVKKG